MVIARTLATEGAWDREQITNLLGLVGQSSRVLVVGAHVGTVVVPLARVVREVVAYEANPVNFSNLEINLRLNNLQNVTVRNVAVSDRAGTLKMLANTTNTGASKVVPQRRSYAYTYDAPTEIEVSAVALDDDLSNAEFDLIVMDIEGSELRALLGMRRVLGYAKYLQIEYLPHLVRDVTGASDEDFLQPIREHFGYGRVAGLSDEFERHRFTELLAIAASQGGADLVFRRG
jgi:FkbM family methyltransferase